MNKKIVRFLYSLILALAVLASLVLNTINQKIILTLFITLVFITFFVYNNKISKNQKR